MPAPTSAASGTRSFPRANACTQRFTRGAPRSFHLDPTGRRLLFVRSQHGTDPMGALWSMDVVTGAETQVADPRALLAGGAEALSAAERARRERSREGAGGIVGYATDRAGEVVAFALSSRLWVADLVGAGGVREVPAPGAVLDPRPDPTGRLVAYAAEGALHVVATDGTRAQVLAEPEHDLVHWGVAEFVAAEEMGRFRGYWWSPTGDALLVARVDDSPLPRWYVADPAQPDRPAVEHRYPAAGSADAVVSLHLLTLDGARTDVDWDGTEFPYLVRVDWSEAGCVLQVMSRDQRRAQVRRLDPATGATDLLLDQRAEVWLDAVDGVPALLPDGRLVVTADVEDTRRLVVDGTSVTPPGLQVESVVCVDDHGVLLHASDDPVRRQLWHWSPAGGLDRLTGPGGHDTGLLAGGTLLAVRRSADQPLPVVTVHPAGGAARTVTSYADTPPVLGRPALHRVGPDSLAVGVVLPRDHSPGTRLPVLLDPYGGPHHREVLDMPERWRAAQWIADQGFAVVKVDGRGTGGRGARWDRAVRDALDATLDDQVAGLHAVAEMVPDLDLDRVGIRGWSFGGYLAALAVLRRPDVFHAAVAGAPVTDWTLYDTFYTERYLGHPAAAAEVYRRNSLVDDAPRLTRPLLLIHGLADDNVVVAHTLRLSAALLAAGKPHDVLPLSGVTHMTPQDVVEEHTLRLQVQWLTRHLAP